MAPSGDFCVLGCCLAGSVLAGSDFDEVFLRRDKGGATPDVFVWQDAVTPGMKLVDIRVNDNLAEHTEVHFVDNGKQRVAPCLTREQLISLGIKIALYDDRTPVTDKTSAATGGDATCEPLEQKIPSSAIAYDATHQVLSITVPQEAVDRQRFTMISRTSGTTASRASVPVTMAIFTPQKRKAGPVTAGARMTRPPAVPTSI